MYPQNAKQFADDLDGCGQDGIFVRFLGFCLEAALK